MSNAGMTHTPGPWRYEMSGADANYMRLYMPGPLTGDVARGYVGEANARLIKEAPDLLDACELMLAEHERISHQMVTGDTPGMTAARAVLARVKGAST